MNIDHVQGNVLAGFKKPHMHFVLLRLPHGTDEALAWLTETRRTVKSSGAVAAGKSKTWHGLGLTRSGLERLGVPGVPGALSDHYAFLAGAQARAADLGDVGESDPSTWLFGNERNPVDAVVTVAADSDAAVSRAVKKVVDRVQAHHGAIAYEQRGHWPDGNREHFGFVDGGGQPRVQGADEGGDVDPGRFVLDGAGVPWLRDASFQVLRLLGQDVRRWRAAGGDPAERIGCRRDGEEAGTPASSHVGKVLPGAGFDQQRHRLIRRGIPYGPPFEEAPNAERGMVFNAFMASIGLQYEYVQRLWANRSDFPVAETGWDPVIGGPDPQEQTYRDAKHPGAAWPARYVRTRGAVYAVALSLPGLRALTPVKRSPGALTG